MLLANIRPYCRKNGNVYQQKMKPTTPNSRLQIRSIKSLEIIAKMKDSTIYIPTNGTQVSVAKARQM